LVLDHPVVRESPGQQTDNSHSRL